MKYIFGDKLFFGFEYVIMVFYCCNLIDVNFLIFVEKEWFNVYNVEVLEKIWGFFDGDKLMMVWFEREM